jgi:1-acyl-sn-glycerol-3-phosphate acyltransferase
MRVPTALGRGVYAVAVTGGVAGYALLRETLGERGAVRRLTPAWARALRRGIGMEVRVHGTEHVPRDRPCVVMCNHQSHLDIAALVLALPIQVGFLAKRELQDIPVFGRAVDAGGHVFIDRRDRKRAHEAIAHAATQVSAGKSIAIFPEGTRSDGRRVKTLKKGGFHLARQADVPIVPVGMRGTAKLLPKHTKRVHPGVIEVHIGPPIDPNGRDVAELDDLVAKVRAEIGRLADLPLADPGEPV